MKNKILPIIAGVLVIIAILVIVIPRNNDEKEELADSKNSNIKNNSVSPSKQVTKSTAKLATLDEDGNVIINSEDLSEDKISFIKYSEDSKIELIAIKGKDGEVNVALGTCQSCNGSPNAYYNQTGNQLQCNNCGLTFPLDVIGVDGSGCHPIMIDESGITKTENGVKIDKAILLKNESLFSTVIAH